MDAIKKTVGVKKLAIAYNRAAKKTKYFNQVYKIVVESFLLLFATFLSS